MVTAFPICDVVCDLGSLPVGVYVFKINNRNTGSRCKIFSKLTPKTTERCQ